MNTTFEAIEKRYACRAFSGAAIPPEALHAVAAAGLHAPSGVNLQPWRIVAISDPAVLAELEQAGLRALKAWDEAGYERVLARGGKLLYNAPAIIVVAKQPSEGPISVDLDVGIVISHLVLAAQSLGLDSCVVALLAAAFAGPDGAALKAKLSFPEGWEFGLAVLLGHAVSPGKPHEIDPAKLIELI
ncbi:MAG: nitroreductase family protein [Propionibacteriaceae bacterium]|nr:nitroreductase family protein [Propionibacteriaceae bacterium]